METCFGAVFHSVEKFSTVWKNQGMAVGGRFHQGGTVAARQNGNGGCQGAEWVSGMGDRVRRPPKRMAPRTARARMGW